MATCIIKISDHPRACGANYGVVHVIAVGVGSSPRMRGKHVQPVVPPNTHRIIPAHAGQTVQVLGSTSATADHPRACGANLPHVTMRSARHGSSPRMRGKPRTPHKTQPAHRIIPAHAGQTAYSCGRAARRTDHPRACGANNSLLLTLTTRRGSSPRMRGKQLRHRQIRAHSRIIPAHAGQTPTV